MIMKHNLIIYCVLIINYNGIMCNANSNFLTSKYRMIKYSNGSAKCAVNNLNGITSTRTRLQCGSECLQSDQCNGFNYRKHSKVCEFVTSTPNYTYALHCSFYQEVTNNEFTEELKCSITTNMAVLKTYEIPNVGSRSVFTINNWIVIFQAVDSVITFDKNWFDFKSGFGNINGNYWLGLQNVYEISTNTKTKLRIDADFGTNCVTDIYNRFYVKDEASNYALYLFDYAGNTVDWWITVDHMNGTSFSTFDRDYDNWLQQSCSGKFSKVGWWFDNCNDGILTTNDGKFNVYYINSKWVVFKLARILMKITG